MRSSIAKRKQTSQFSRAWVQVLVPTLLCASSAIDNPIMSSQLSQLTGNCFFLRNLQALENLPLLLFVLILLLLFLPYIQCFDIVHNLHQGPNNRTQCKYSAMKEMMVCRILSQFSRPVDRGVCTFKLTCENCSRGCWA